MVNRLARLLKEKFASNSKKNLHVRLKKPIYFNRYSDRDVLIVATGPSLKEYGKRLADYVVTNRDTLITIGVNYLDDLLIPDYHMFTNRKKFCTFVHAVQEKPIILLAPSIAKKVINSHMKNRYYEEIMFKELVPSKGQHAIEEGSIKVDENGIFYTKGSTVATTALGVAIAMGMKNVSFAGLDGFSMYEPDKIHHFKVDDVIPFERRLTQEKVTADILDNANNILAKRGGQIRIITPTVYKKYYDSVI
ncbi:MAG TPA: 6-hydroxymethylpterin diphosphokinase MptE-like protein [Nitrospinota bacterium]|nr:6-hydroxymethylpterin diphosphokinase MptE-like protein [Nitrospinota bacterium]|tara:strand:- start:3055 stop:3801 length:747 start_codon:yes stop_codon:yes gene_type:complete